MGTNTVYHTVITDKQPESSTPNNCKLENLFLVARHGTRYPEESDLEKFDELEKVFQNVPSSSKHEVFTKMENLVFLKSYRILLNLFFYSGKIDFHYQKKRYYILEAKKSIIHWENVHTGNIINSGKRLFPTILILLILEVQKFQGILCYV
jgi:hypothetical protein